MTIEELEAKLETATRERDEARANHAAAGEAFREATRLRSEIQQARIKAENERDEARAEVERLTDERDEARAQLAAELKEKP